MKADSTALDARLLELEQAGWQSLVDGTGRAHYRELLGDGALVVKPGCGVVTGERALDQLSGDTCSWFRIRAPQVVALGDDAASITYRVIARRDFDHEYQAVATSVYRSFGGEWKLVVHQQTPV